MVEGGSSKAFTMIKKMMYAEPLALHALLDKLAKSVMLYLNAQIKAGAQSVMIFATWGGVLTGSDYQQFSLYYMHKIVDGLLLHIKPRLRRRIAGGECRGNRGGQLKFSLHVIPLAADLPHLNLASVSALLLRRDRRSGRLDG